MIDKADVLIVTVTDVESRAVMEAFREVVGKEPKPEPISDRIYLDLGDVNGTRVFMALSEMGSGGVGGSQKSVDKGIEALSPAAVIMVGIAFGINEVKQSIGDVLVSQQLWLYDLQRVGKDQIIPRGDKPHASAWLINWLQVANLKWDQSKAKIRTGVVLSGEKLVDNIDYRGQLKQFALEAIGGEMEGAGLYVASQDKKVDWILVKGICDWADGEKGTDKDSRQRLAARNAAEFVLHALQHASLKRDHGSYSQTKRSFPTPTTPEPTKVVPSSLPSQPYFFGREKELGIIAEAIAPEARTWGALIDGPGGIGKTALAVRAADTAPDSNFDRKIFLSAKVRELTPQGERQLEDFMLPNYMTLLTELGRELGNDSIERTDPSDRANAVRRALTSVRVLIVIDNVETFPEAEHVRLYQFLSRLPATCKAIVTSRRRADIDARVVRLDRLAYKDALDLLGELAKNNRHLQKATERERRELYEMTNGNPLLLKWAVGQLGRPGSRCRTVNDVSEFLKAAPAENDPLEYIFGDLLDTFTESETAVLAALAHFKEPAKVKWIADVAGLAENVALTALEDLTDRALLMSDETQQSFLLPDLAAAFLRRKRPDVIANTGQRIANRADTSAVENGYDNFERFPILQSEWPAIAAALPLFMAGDNDRLQKVCTALDTFLHFSGRWDEQLAVSEFAEERALTAGDFYSAGWRAFDAGWIYYLRGTSQRVLACATRCAAHWQSAPQAGSREAAFASRLRGIGYELEQNYAAATEAYQAALELYRAAGVEGAEIATTLSSLGDVAHAQENYSAAESYYSEALQTAQTADDWENLTTITGNLAILAVDREDWTAAEKLAREALQFAEKVGRQESVGSQCSFLAAALVAQDRIQEALPYAQRAVEVFTRLRQPGRLEYARSVLESCGAESASKPPPIN